MEREMQLCLKIKFEIYFNVMEILLGKIITLFNIQFYLCIILANECQLLIRN